MNTLTKSDLVDALMQKLNLEKRDAKLLVDGFFNGIHQSLVQGKSVRLSGFGNFILRDKSARPGRNPKTGEEVEVAARRVVTFRAGAKLKNLVHDA
jgi:integration host factor subunit alpha